MHSRDLRRSTMLTDAIKGLCRSPPDPYRRYLLTGRGAKCVNHRLFQVAGVTGRPVIAALSESPCWCSMPNLFNQGLSVMR